MPYLRCSSCGVVSYAPVNGANAVCPECGVPWPGRADEVIRSADPEKQVTALVRMTRALLDTDVAMLTSVAHGRETARVVAGQWPGIPGLQGMSLPLEDTFCQRMLEGRIPNAVGDVRNDDRVADLTMSQNLGVGCWMGVPIQLSSTLYVLCCLAREARPSLGEKEIRLLFGLGESVRAQLTAD